MDLFKKIHEDLVKQPIAELAEKYLAQGRYRNTLRALKKGFDLDPDYPPFLWLAAQAEFHLENYEAAAELLDDLALQETRDALPQRYFYRGVIRFHLGAFQAALADLGEAIRLQAHAPEAFFYRGMAHLQLKQIPAALRDLHAAEASLTDKQPLYRFLSEAYRKQKKWKPALDYLNKVEEPGAKELFTKGEILIALREPREAIYCFSQVIGLEPENTMAYCRRGGQYLSLGMMEKALQDLNHCLKHNPDCAEAYCDRGWVMVQQEAYESARQDFDKALTLRPTYAKVYRNKAYLYMALDQIEEMGPQLDQAFRLDPSLALLHFLQGEYYYRRGMVPQALEAWHRSAGLGEAEGVAALEKYFDISI